MMLWKDLSLEILADIKFTVTQKGLDMLIWAGEA